MIKNRTPVFFSGFTLLELMIVIAIMAITLGYGIPASTSMISEYRLTTAANDMLLALQLARSEAAKKIQYSGVKLHGFKWEVYVGNENNILRYFEASPSILISNSNDISNIVYSPDARVDYDKKIELNFKYADLPGARTLNIFPSGRITITK